MPVTSNLILFFKEQKPQMMLRCWIRTNGRYDSSKGRKIEQKENLNSTLTTNDED